jgi:NADH-ubiquinone oxidoreductase chain 1
MALMLLSLVYLVRTYSLFLINLRGTTILLIYFYTPVFLCWCVTILAETNRPPFDFAEGESELVSGFNVDYRRGGFAFLFLAEYAIILFISYFIRVLFFGGLKFSIVILLGCFFSFGFI